MHSTSLPYLHYIISWKYYTHVYISNTLTTYHHITSLLHNIETPLTSIYVVTFNLMWKSAVFIHCGMLIVIMYSRVLCHIYVLQRVGHEYRAYYIRTWNIICINRIRWNLLIICYRLGSNFRLVFWHYVNVV